jgi:hypothetical protein
MLEGSVQRKANRVRRSFIDARTDAHLWAQTHDRDLDVFAMQSEIAQNSRPADQVVKKEKAAIEERLTKDLLPTTSTCEQKNFSTTRVVSPPLG